MKQIHAFAQIVELRIVKMVDFHLFWTLSKLNVRNVQVLDVVELSVRYFRNENAR